VDDDHRIVQLLGDCFKHSYTVGVALNAGEAFGMLRRERPDVVLLDVILPGMSGMHLLKEIKRSDPPNPKSNAWRFIGQTHAQR
jgi:DNA-binding response OmpR family regulator